VVAGADVVVDEVVGADVVVVEAVVGVLVGELTGVLAPPLSVMELLTAASYRSLAYACDASHNITPPKDEYCSRVATAIEPRVAAST